MCFANFCIWYKLGCQGHIKLGANAEWQFQGKSNFSGSIPDLGFPGDSVVKNPPTNAGDSGLIPRPGRSPWRRKWQPTPVFLPGKSHGQRSLAGYSLWSRKRVGHDLAAKQQQAPSAVVVLLLPAESLLLTCYCVSLQVVSPVCSGKQHSWQPWDIYLSLLLLPGFDSLW